MLSLKDRVAVITGASHGIGRAVAIGLAREGCDTVLVARTKDALDETAKRIREAGHKALVCPTDISKPEDIQKLAKVVQKEFGSLDILWNGAFGWIDGAIEDNSEEDLIYFLDTSVRGSILVTKALMPLLLKASRPHVINVSADWEFPEMEGVTVFIAAKRALAGMGIALQKEKKGEIRVTNLHPADVASMDYDIDDPVQKILKETNLTKIPLSELVELVILVLKLEGTIVHQINFKPIKQEIGMTFL